MTLREILKNSNKIYINFVKLCSKIEKIKGYSIKLREILMLHPTKFMKLLKPQMQTVNSSIILLQFEIYKISPKIQ